LIHTSVPRGLEGGTGFAVAARTGGMPRVLSESVAALSGLAEAWDGASDWDRTLRATRSINAPSGPVWVASVIRPNGVDHTGRGNRLAHHRVLDHDELQRCDPAGLLADHERWIAAWDGEPRELDVPESLPEVPAHAGPADTWRGLFGDAGMAADSLERAFRSGIGAWIIVPAGSDRLALLREMVALLPPANRWKRGWSTRPLRPAADPVPVICVVDEREPEVRKAPVNAAWMFRPTKGGQPVASEALLKRARDGATHLPTERVQRAAASVHWAPPRRLEVEPLAPAGEHPAQSPPPAMAPAAIHVELQPPARRGWPTASAPLNWLAWLSILALCGGLAWWLLRGANP
jgi:hypothetical protein